MSNDAALSAGPEKPVAGSRDEPPALSFSLRFRFADWPNPELPPIAIGVYLIWQREQLMYCGVSGRGLNIGSSGGRSAAGLVTRLKSHWTGRLSGDQFCVYVANQLVIPNLTTSDLKCFADRSKTLDSLTRLYIHENFDYQFAIARSYSDALRFEASCRSGHVFGMKPTLHPKLDVD